MRRCVLTEKPSVARDIAKAIAAEGTTMTDSKTYLEGKGRDGCYYYITWCYGHLLEMYAPEGDGKWSMDELPILPDRFHLRPLKDVDKNGKEVEGTSSYEKRLSVISHLFERVDQIIAATDAGREGQLIFENVYHYLECTKPVLRLWTSSLTEDALQEGFNGLRDNDEYQPMYKAAYERSVADWLVGVNCTRTFTLLSGARTVYSIGRVQTPALKMICERYEEHVNFKSIPYWFLDGRSAVDGKEFGWRSEDRYNDKPKGEDDYYRIMRQGYISVDEVKIERKNEQPPLLHDIASLQKLANRQYGISMEDSLEALENLYLKGLTSYPRTDSRYISEDVFRKVPSILDKFTSHPVYGDVAFMLSNSDSLCRRSVDDTKLTDHHALIVTGKKCPGNLTENENKVYDLVLARFLEAFSPMSVADVTTVRTSACGVRFITRGRVSVSLGWRIVGNSVESEGVNIEEVDDVGLGMGELPEMREGDRIPIASLELVEDKTKPRPLFTDATFLTAMENAGSNIENKEVRDILKTVKGIGTPATRTEIKTTLINRKYIVVKGKSLTPTEKGLTLYRAIRNEEVSSVELTAEWEKNLADIADNGTSPDSFRKKILRQTERYVNELSVCEGVKALKKSNESSVLKCPKCGSEMRLGDKCAYCRGCKFTVWRHQGGKAPNGKDLGEGTMRTLIEKGQTGVISGFKKDGKEYSAMLTLRQDGTVQMDFPKSVRKN